jgi:hypothetical protein
MKFCKDCKHFVSLGGDWMPGLMPEECSAPALKCIELVHGREVYLDNAITNPTLQRRNNDGCGPIGRWFKPLSVDANIGQ